MSNKMNEEASQYCADLWKKYFEDNIKCQEDIKKTEKFLESLKEKLNNIK